MKKNVLFIQGAGEGAYEEDALLAASLQDAIGSAYTVRYPRMPEEDSATYEDWKAPIVAELSALDGAIILVGHSVGGSVLLKYLSTERAEKRIAGLFVIAAPYWSDDNFWNWDEARLSPDAAEKLASIPRIFFYHNRDDEFVPFAHFTEYAATIPQATFREYAEGGHQFRNDLSKVARDITSLEIEP